jgi:hypothetical protein
MSLVDNESSCRFSYIYDLMGFYVVDFVLLEALMKCYGFCG